MNEKEMTELNLWIAEHVMGAKWCDNFLILDGVIFFKRGKRGKEFTPIGYPRGNFIPTTDPAAALSVLEKCCNSRSVIVNNPPDGKYIIAELMRGPLGFIYPEKEIEADTLPLAICLFSQKLFSK